MGSINANAAAMPPHAHSATAGAAGADAAHGAHDAAGADHGGHAEPKAPKSGDPRFIAGSTGEFGESKKIQQKDGPAYGGQKVAKQQNNNDKKQNDYNTTDANFMRTLGLIADPDSGQPMSYAQSIQAYNGAGAIQELFPATYKKLIENQDAGRGTVLGGTLAILGITQSDGFNGASLKGIDPADINKIRTTQLGNLGSLRDVVLDTRDFKGREWNRAHHPGSSWTAMKPLVEESGFAWNEAALLTGDSMISWSGRVLGSNNQDGDQTGFAADELAGLKYMVLMEQATGKNALEHVLAGHAATHLPEDKLTDPKINKFIGLPKDFRPTTPEDIAMVAGRIRQWALQPGVQVNQGEFNKFVKAGMKTQGGQQLAASGLLNNVQFKPQQPKTAGGGGGGNNVDNDAITPTGLGQGQLPNSYEMDIAAPIDLPAMAPQALAPALAPDTLGGGAASADELLGSPTINTRPTLENLGKTGPLPVLDPKTGVLNKMLRDQLMTALLEVIYDAHKSPFLDAITDRKAFVDGATKGPKFVKDQVASDPKLVTELKAELTKALEDGNLSEAEINSLSEKLADAGMEDLASALKEGKMGDKEMAVLFRKIDGAVSSKLEKDLTAALEDGKLSDEERAGLESRLGKEGLASLEKSIEDGTVTPEELKSIAAGAKADEASKADKTDKVGDTDKVGETDEADETGETDKAEKADKTDAKAGADEAGDTKKADPDKPSAAADGAKAGAEGVDGSKKPADGEKAAKDGVKAVKGDKADDAKKADSAPKMGGEAGANADNPAPPVAA